MTRFKKIQHWNMARGLLAKGLFDVDYRMRYDKRVNDALDAIKWNEKILYENEF